MNKKKFSYKRKVLLEKIRERNPNLSLEVIDIIISNYEKMIASKVNSISLVNTTIPLFGNIHTHKNRVNFLFRENNKKLVKIRSERVKKSAKNLLF